MKNFKCKCGREMYFDFNNSEIKHVSGKDYFFVGCIMCGQGYIKERKEYIEIK